MSLSFCIVNCVGIFIVTQSGQNRKTVKKKKTLRGSKNETSQSYQHSPTIFGFITWPFTEALLGWGRKTACLAANFPQSSAVGMLILGVIINLASFLVALSPLTGPLSAPAGCCVLNMLFIFNQVLQ